VGPFRRDEKGQKEKREKKPTEAHGRGGSRGKEGGQGIGGVVAPSPTGPSSGLRAKNGERGYNIRVERMGGARVPERASVARRPTPRIFSYTFAE
jgi:hypothetical protein